MHGGLYERLYNMVLPWLSGSYRGHRFEYLWVNNIADNFQEFLDSVHVQVRASRRAGRDVGPAVSNCIQLQPFLAAFPQGCTGQPGPVGPA
jgi:hypothetical protein